MPWIPTSPGSSTSKSVLPGVFLCPRDSLLLTAPCHTGEAAINRGLAKRLEQLADERERRQRAAERADAEFTLEFLNAAREVFQMIDKDDSGTLDEAEIVDAVRDRRCREERQKM